MDVMDGCVSVTTVEDGGIRPVATAVTSTYPRQRHGRGRDAFYQSFLRFHILRCASYLVDVDANWYQKDVTHVNGKYRNIEQKKKKRTGNNFPGRKSFL